MQLYKKDTIVSFLFGILKTFQEHLSCRTPVETFRLVKISLCFILTFAFSFLCLKEWIKLFRILQKFICKDYELRFLTLTHFNLVLHFICKPVIVQRFHCVKSVQIRFFLWSIFSRIRTEYGDLRSKSVRIQANKEQKKICIWRLFKPCRLKWVKFQLYPVTLLYKSFHHFQRTSVVIVKKANIVHLLKLSSTKN